MELAYWSTGDFCPGDKGTVYTALSKEDSPSVVAMRLDTSGTGDPRPIGRGLRAAVSARGDMALLKPASNNRQAELVRVGSSENDTSVLGSGIRAADWGPGGQALAWVRLSGDGSVVEFPAGHPVFCSTSWISDFRVSPRGDQAALVEHPVHDDDGGFVRLVDQNGESRRLTETLEQYQRIGLGSFRKRNLVYGEPKRHGDGVVCCVTSGQLRPITGTAGSLRLLDIGPRGRALMSVEDVRATMIAKGGQDISETDISHLDDSSVAAISADGSKVFFTEGGNGAGRHYMAFVCDLRGHHTRLVGSGRAMTLSPDGRLAITTDPEKQDVLNVIALDGSATRHLSGRGFSYQWVRFLTPDLLLVSGSMRSGPLGVYKQTLNGGEPTRLANVPYVDYPSISPRNDAVAGVVGGRLIIVSLLDENITRLPFTGVVPAAWSRDERWL